MTFINDPIADFIVRLKNAGAVKKDMVSVPYSKMKHAIAEVLLRAGFISALDKKGTGVKKTLEVQLAYNDKGDSKIQSFKRVSKPGRRLYRSVREIYSIKNGKGISVFSTPKGILTDKEARKENVGGEILFEIF